MDRKHSDLSDSIGEIIKIAAGEKGVRYHLDCAGDYYRSQSEDINQWAGETGAVRIARGFERTLAFEQYEPIALSPPAAGLPLASWFTDDVQDRAAREAAAVHAVFDDQGNASSRWLRCILASANAWNRLYI